MRFTHEPDEYLKNYKEYDALDEIKFLPEQSKEEVIGKLKEISFRKKEIAQKQNITAQQDTQLDEIRKTIEQIRSFPEYKT